MQKTVILLIDGNESAQLPRERCTDVMHADYALFDLNYDRPVTVRTRTSVNSSPLRRVHRNGTRLRK